MTDLQQVSNNVLTCFKQVLNTPENPFYRHTFTQANVEKIGSFLLEKMRFLNQFKNLKKAKQNSYIS